MSVLLAAFADDEAPAARLAADLGLPLRLADLHTFPDGETVVVAPTGAETVILYRALHQPNAKLMPLLQACDGWKRAGVRRRVLVAPYMPYLRQDAVFRPGQPVSRDVIGRLLGAHFERIVTVDPHLHRTPSLDPVFAPARVTVLSAAAVLADALGPAHDVIVVGPDEEAGPWAAALAGGLGAPHLVLRKVRRGDRQVELAPPPGDACRRRRVILVDDICASGATLEAALRALHAAGAAKVDVAVTHALFDSHARARLMAAGAGIIVATDSCPHPQGRAPLHAILAAALQDELGPSG